MNSFLPHKLFIVAAMLFVATNVSAQADKLTYTVSDGSATITGFTNGISLETLTIPSTINYNDNDVPVTAIADGAFANNPQLTKVTLPSSNLTKIGKWSFAFCNLTTIGIEGTTTNELPSSITEIDSFAFAGNTQLDTIIIPKSVTTFGEGAFWCCFKLGVGLEDGNKVLTMGTGDDAGVLFSTNKDTLYFFPNTPLMTRKYQYMVPTSVTRIGAGAFGLDKTTNQIVTAVILPTNLTSIGDLAFNSCPLAKSPIESLTIPNKTKSLGNGCLPNGLQELVLLCLQDQADNFVDSVKKAFTPIKKTFNSVSKTCGDSISGVNVYVRPWSYSHFSSLTSISNSNNSIDTLHYNIPVTLPANRKFVSLSRDFPIAATIARLGGSCMEGSGEARFYVVYREYTNVHQKDSIKQRKRIIASREDFIPARGPHDTYMGVIICDPSENVVNYDRTLYYQICTNQGSYTQAPSFDESNEGLLATIQYQNMLLASPCRTLVNKDTETYTVSKKTGSSAAGQAGLEDSTIIGYTYGLNNNVFKKINRTGYVNAQKAYMVLDQALVEGDPPQAKPSLEIVFEDSTPTGISNVSTEVDKGSNKWFTLQGVSLSEEPTQPGIYIHNGKKVIIR